MLDKVAIPQAYKPVDVAAPDGIGWRSPSIIQNMITYGKLIRLS